MLVSRLLLAVGKPLNPNGTRVASELVSLPARNFSFEFLDSGRVFPEHEDLTRQVVPDPPAGQAPGRLQRPAFHLQTLLLGDEI